MHLHTRKTTCCALFTFLIDNLHMIDKGGKQMHEFILIRDESAYCTSSLSFAHNNCDTNLELIRQRIRANR